MSKSNGIDTEDIVATGKSKKKRNGFLKEMHINWQLYVMLILPVAYLLIFAYGPMLGIQIAFKDYKMAEGIWGSKWIGFDHFIRFFKSMQFPLVMKNTLFLSLYNLLVSTPMALFLAVCVNYLTNAKYKKTVQMITYAPHFISVVIMVAIMNQMLATRTGIVNNIIVLLGFTRIEFLGKAQYFRHLYVWSGVWQEAGWNSIIYISALAGIDPQIHEAAIVDGATKIRRIFSIDLPSIMPTFIILMIMNVGRIMNVGFTKVFAMQNTLNKTYSEVIETYVYNITFTSGLPNYSYTTAIGLFNSVIGVILITVVNGLSRKLTESSLW